MYIVRCSIISLCQGLNGTKLHFKTSSRFVARPLLLFSRLPTLKVEMKYIIYTHTHTHCCPSLLKHCRQKYLEARKAQSLKYDLSTRSITDQEIIPHCELSPSGRHCKRHTVDGSKSITPIAFRILNAASASDLTHT